VVCGVGHCDTHLVGTMMCIPLNKLFFFNKLRFSMKLKFYAGAGYRRMKLPPQERSCQPDYEVEDMIILKREVLRSWAFLALGKLTSWDVLASLSSCHLQHQASRIVFSPVSDIVCSLVTT